MVPLRRALLPAVLLPAGLALCAGCASDDPALLQIPVVQTPSEAAFDLEDAVSIELIAASLTVSELRLEAPASSARVHRLPGSELVSWLGPTAHAHPGHESAGGVLGELSGTWTLDLLGEESPMGTASCYEGELATASLSLVAEPVALLEGVATVDGEERPFSFEVALDEHVTGMDVVASLDAASPPAGLVYAVDLAHALSYVAWTDEDTDADGLLTEADASFANTVAFGLASTPTHSLTLED